MFKTKHFILEELVHPAFLSPLSVDKIWGLLDERILRSIDSLRENLSTPIIINTPTNLDRGLRRFDSAVGAKYSQHKFGRAMDIVVDGIPALDVQIHIRDNIKKYPFITAMETGTAQWTHIDCRNQPEYTLGSPLYAFPVR